MTTGVIPFSKLDSLDKLNEAVSVLVAKGESIDVCDASTDLVAKQFLVECKSYEKAVDLFSDPEITDLRERTSRLVAAKKSLLAPMLRVFEMVKGRSRVWEEAERVATAKANEKANKKGGEAIEIKPAIPTLQGVPSRRLYKVRVENADAVLEDYLKAKRGRTKEDVRRAMFLRSYIKIDEAAIQAVARSEKGWKVLQEEKVPGLKFWTE